MRFSLRAFVFVAASTAAWVASGSYALALNGRWQPPDIRPSSATLADVLAKYRATQGNLEARYAQRVEHYTLTVGDEKLGSTFAVSGDDFLASTTIDGAIYEEGRHNGLRWRRTPAGLTRIVESDIQGDDLDRWPLALLPICRADCALVGEYAGPSPAWVVEYRPRREYPHWFYVDEQSGLITREVLRDGSRVNAIAFDDFRTAAGATRPYHWRISGAGAAFDVAVESIEFGSIGGSAVAIPPSNVAVMTVDAGPSIALPAQFEQGQIRVKVTLNGKPLVFILDSGTAQIILDDATARSLGLRAVLGHAMVRDLSVGPAHLQNASVLTVPLGRGFDFAGILGYDFFVGHIVHIDYKHERVELLAHTAFVPPVGAFTLEAWCGEGVPLIPVPFGDAVAERFLLDTGSWDLVLTRNLLDRPDIGAANIGLGRPYGGVGRLGFLEGVVPVERADLRAIRIGRVTIKSVRALVERPNAGDAIEIPLDGIIGLRLLTQFEWWFDYDGSRVWFQPT